LDLEKAAERLSHAAGKETQRALLPDARRAIASRASHIGAEIGEFSTAYSH